jgi:hypothetical protein
MSGQPEDHFQIVFHGSREGTVFFFHGFIKGPKVLIHRPLPFQMPAARRNRLLHYIERGTVLPHFFARGYSFRRLKSFEQVAGNSLQRKEAEPDRPDFFKTIKIVNKSLDKIMKIQ